MIFFKDQPMLRDMTNFKRGAIKKVGVILVES